MAQSRISKPGRQLSVVPIGHLAVEQQRKPIQVRKRGGVAWCGDFIEGLGHAEQPELIELVEGRMDEHVVSSMVIARAADVGVEDRHAVRAARSVGVTVQIVVEDRSDGAVGPCPDVERARGSGLNPRHAERLDQPHDPQTRPKALFGMRAMLQNQLAQRRRRRAYRGGICTDAIECVFQ